MLMFGGIDTTEGMILNAVWHLLGDREAVALLSGGADLLPNAIEESIRLGQRPRPSTDMPPRCRGWGARIRRGDLVTVSIAGANRDPAVFTTPTRSTSARQRQAEPRLRAGPARLPRRTAGKDRDDDRGRPTPGPPARAAADPDYPNAPRGLVFRKPPTLHVRWTL